MLEEVEYSDYNYTNNFDDTQMDHIDQATSWRSVYSAHNYANNYDDDFQLDDMDQTTSSLFG